jgi:cell cycle checkpoint protein
MSWLSSTFEDELQVKGTFSRRQKGKKNSKARKGGGVGELWVEVHTPSVCVDLAVHKKKIQEVEEWLKNALNTSSKMVRILLLTGPPGCGKSATVRALSNEMEFDIKEWINPVLEVFTPTDSNSEGSRWGGAPHQESQSKMFTSFLLDANRFCGVVGTSDHSKQVILVEELPNVYHYDPTKLHNILRSLSAHCLRPVVFVMSDSTRRESSASQLFPKQLLSQLGVTTISFNPVAHTSLVKSLTKIATSESKTPSGRNQFHPPTKDLIESLAVSSGGDIRSAINSLQFACTRRGPSGVRKLTKTQRKLGKRSHSSSSMSEFLSLTDSSGQPEVERLSTLLGSRDHSLFLFRALGKVLYCKRLTGDQASHNTPTTTPTESTPEESHVISLPPHLNHCQRAPLAINPEVVVENTHMSGEMFTLFLHQNYIQFFSSCDDLLVAAEYFSDSDLLHGMEWAQRDGSSSKGPTKHLLSGAVASRGVMYANTSVTTGKHTWRPLHKPEWSDVSRKEDRLVLGSS